MRKGKVKSSKGIVALLLAFLTILNSIVPNVTTVYAATSASSYITKMNSALKKVKSYHISQTMSTDMSLSMVVGQEKQTQATKMKQTLSQTVVNKPLLQAKSIVKNTTISDGKKQSETSKVYLKQQKNGSISVYEFSNGSKTPSKSVIHKKLVNSILNTIDTNMLVNAKIIKDNVEVNGINTVEVSAQITGKEIDKLIKDMLKISGDLSKEELKEANKAFDFSKVKPITCTYYINKKTYLPVKCIGDVSDFVESFYEVMLNMMFNEKISISENEIPSIDEIPSIEMKVTCKKASMTMTYSDYNKTKSIKYPKSCK